MHRCASEPRAGWESLVRRQGLVYNDAPLADGRRLSYWNEHAYYELTAAQVDELEAATAELFEMCIAAGDAMLERGLAERLGIPAAALPAIGGSWHDDTSPSIYGRFDLRYDGSGPPKLLEFNADTPTSLLEAAVVQWFWLQDRFPEADQWNSLHERLVAAWRRRLLQRHLPPGPVHFTTSTADVSGEDYLTTRYLQDTAEQAGVDARWIDLERIGLHPQRGFVDEDDEPMPTIFKLYPWEWLLDDDFGAAALARMGRGRGLTTWIEPPYKLLWSNKGLLPVLWELFPGHPLLLECYFDDPGPLTSYVRKPLLGREGANVSIVRDGRELARAGGDYGDEGYVFQALAPLPAFDGHHVVAGAWVVDGEPAGLGLRESDGMITDDASRFVPHLIRR